MTTTTKPSEGALRAANAINMCEGDIYYEDDIETWAEIIDRETHAGDMLEALERIASDQLWQSSRDGSDFAYKVRNIARESVRRARGGE